jgi:Uma2 family endonuclease
METATLTPGKKARWTDAEIMRWPKDGYKRELIEGDIYMSPVGYTHTNVCVNVLFMFTAYVREHNLGKICDSSIGFRLGPKSLLSPDVSFVSNERFEKILVVPEKYFVGTPDLAVEVISPSDLRGVVSLKLDKYLLGGTHVAWLIDPKKATAEVRTLTSSKTLTGLDDLLDGGDVIPGFQCQLSAVFAP